MRSRAKEIVCLAAVASLFGQSSGSASDFTQFYAAVCSQLKPLATASATVYAVRSQNEEHKPLEKLVLNDLRGRVVHFFYVVQRSELPPKGTSISGAISAKGEFWTDWDESENGKVHLFNNSRQNDPKACRLTEFQTYQEFHLHGTVDYCLELRFHNGPGKFNTVERRELFAFPKVSPWDLLFSRWVDDPVTRNSLILNYTLNGDGAPLCVPFRMTVPSPLAKARITINDLLEDSDYQGTPRISWESRDQSNGR